MNIETVTVYSSPGCSHCHSTKRLLNELDVEFGEVDVSQNDDALMFLQAQGFQQVPVVHANNQWWSGHQPERIRALVTSD